jgi:hypothetical protein
MLGGLIMERDCNWTDKQFIDAIAQSSSIEDLAHILGHIPSGALFLVFYNEIDRLKLNVSHWKNDL